MSDFIEYKPMEVKHNVKAAVENLRKAYWSNETEKVAKHFTAAEDIIISAICHGGYTVCKETVEGDLISREAFRKHYCKINCGERQCVDHADRCSFIDELMQFKTEPERPQYNQIAWEQGYEAGLAQGKHRPQGEWIEFADYVARNVVSEDFSEDVDFYAEVLCRKLVKLGLVKLDGDIYKYCGADMRGTTK